MMWSLIKIKTRRAESDFLALHFLRRSAPSGWLLRGCRADKFAFDIAPE
jgi:hypothetical protein